MKQLCAKVGLGLPSDLPAFMRLPADAVMDANQFDLWSHRCKTWLDRQKAIKELALEAGATSVHVEQRDCSQLAPLLLDASTVRKVSICDCYVSNAALLSIAQLLRDRLKSLSIVTSKGFDDVGVKALAAYCAELQATRRNTSLRQPSRSFDAVRRSCFSEERGAAGKVAGTARSRDMDTHVNRVGALR
eukprot:981207-Pleurochrysis_carterae.AAC.2